MKKIDLTLRIHRVATQNINSPFPIMSMKELMMIARGKGELLYAVVEALASYSGGAIEEANDTLALIESLKANPICSVSNEQFALIENALASATVEVKATWANMVSQLNMEE